MSRCGKPHGEPVLSGSPTHGEPVLSSLATHGEPVLSGLATPSKADVARTTLLEHGVDVNRPVYKREVSSQGQPGLSGSAHSARRCIIIRIFVHGIEIIRLVYQRERRHTANRHLQHLQVRPTLTRWMVLHSSCAPGCLQHN